MQWWLTAATASMPPPTASWRCEPPPRVIDRSTQVRVYQAFGELKPGVTIEQARAEIEAIHARAQREQPHPVRHVERGRDADAGQGRRAVASRPWACCCRRRSSLLLITCANVANLLLSRSAARRKEIALRMSVGSGPLRVVRQLLAESLAYALLGGIGGVLLASWLINAVIGSIGPAVPRLTETTLDLGVMTVALAISIGDGAALRRRAGDRACASPTCRRS